MPVCSLSSFPSGGIWNQVDWRILVKERIAKIEKLRIFLKVSIIFCELKYVCFLFWQTSLHMTCNMLRMTHDIYLLLIFIVFFWLQISLLCLVLVLLSAHLERFSLSRMQAFVSVYFIMISCLAF